MKDDRIIRTMYFHGSLNQLEARMERLGDQGSWRGWTFDGKRLYLNQVDPDDEADRERRPSSHKSWEICHFPQPAEDYFDTDFGGSGDGANYAGIEAYEDLPDATTVVFWNGYTPRDRYAIFPEVSSDLLDECLHRIVREANLTSEKPESKRIDEEGGQLLSELRTVLSDLKQTAESDKAVSDAEGGARAQDESPDSPQETTTTETGLPSTTGYIFRQTGEVWEIAYGGKPFHLNNLKGLSIMYELLRTPRVSHRVTELEAAVEGVTADARARLEDREMLDSVTDLGDGQDVIDEQTRAACKARLVAIAEERLQAEQERDMVRTASLEEEEQEITDYLDRSTALRGRSRKFSDEFENARKRVSYVVGYAIKKIKKQSPELALHLSDSIKTGNTCSYVPPQSEEVYWKL